MAACTSLSGFYFFFIYQDPKMDLKVKPSGSDPVTNNKTDKVRTSDVKCFAECDKV